MPKEILDQWRSIGKIGAADFKAWEKRAKDSDKGNFFKAIDADVSGDIAPVIDSLKKAFAGNRNWPRARHPANALKLCLLWRSSSAALPLTGSNNTKVKVSKVIASGLTAITSITACANVVYCRDERHGAAWRHHSLCWHLPAVRGLFPPGHSPCRLMKQRVVCHDP